MAEERNKMSLRSRLHFWLCDSLNIVSQDDFIHFCEHLDQYLAKQNQFNQLVGNKLKLKRKDKEIDSGNIDRGMFG